MFINQSDLLKDNPTQLNYGVAVTDVDADGAFELFVAGFGERNLVLKWNGEGFQDIADDTLADPGRQAIGVAAGDLNSDGQEEIYILNTDTFAGRKSFGDRLLLHRGRGWVDLFSVEENRDALNMTAGRSVCVVDRNGTGQYGFFIANYGGPMRLYELDETGLVVDVAPGADLAKVTGGRGLIALPLVSERMDIFAGNERGQNFLFINQGDGTYKEDATEYGLADPQQHVRGIAPVDANNDGEFDLVYGNWEGPHRLFIRQPSGKFVDSAPMELATPSRIRTVIAADFDNDGYQEVFFNNIGQPNHLFGRRGGEWVELDIGEAAEPYGLGTGAAVGDFDGDGRLELLISHGESGMQPLSLYHTVENDNDWLRVYPTTPYGAPARGAVVRLTTEDENGLRTQIRAVDAGSGYLCQMEPVAHFGLGAPGAVKPKAVEIRWPDGAKTTVRAPRIEINTVLHVSYPGPTN